MNVMISKTWYGHTLYNHFQFTAKNWEWQQETVKVVKCQNKTPGGTFHN